MLETLLQELQDQLDVTEPVMSAGQVAEAAASESLNVTLPVGISNDSREMHFMKVSCAVCNVLD